MKDTKRGKSLMGRPIVEVVPNTELYKLK